MVYLGLNGVNSSTTIMDFIGDGSAARVSNNDFNGTYKTAYIMYNKEAGTVTTGAASSTILAIYAIYNIPLK